MAALNNGILVGQDIILTGARLVRI